MLVTALCAILGFIVLIMLLVLGTHLGPQGNWIGDFEQALRDNGEI